MKDPKDNIFRYKTPMDNERKKEQDRLAYHRKRDRDKAKLDGTYVSGPLEQAKDFLCEMEQPELAAVYTHKEIGPLLTDADKRHLINFIY